MPLDSTLMGATNQLSTKPPPLKGAKLGQLDNWFVHFIFKCHSQSFIRAVVLLIMIIWSRHADCTWLSTLCLSFPLLSVSSLEPQKPASPIPTKHSLKYESQRTRIKEECRIWKRERTTLRFWWGFSRCLFSILRQLLFLWHRGVSEWLPNAQ